MKLRQARRQSIRTHLDEIYDKFSSEEYLAKDPLGALDQGLSKKDLELSSFLIAGLSYGRVEQIYRSFEKLMKGLESILGSQNGAGIHQWLIENKDTLIRRESQKALKNWRHRLNTGEDIAELLTLLSPVLKNYSSLEAVFSASNASQMEERICAFSEKLSGGVNKNSRKTSEWKGTGSQWFYASPKNKSTCKRMLMWLRWMIRKDNIDLGLWNQSRSMQADLFWPIDTHIMTWAKSQRLSKRKTATWMSVLELTDVAKQINPEDPIKYDFALCQSGMQTFRSGSKSRR